MGIEIKIIVKHEPEFDKFNKVELAYDICKGFTNTTGYLIHHLDIQEK